MQLNENEGLVYNDYISLFQSLMHDGEIYKLFNAMVYNKEQSYIIVRNVLRLILNERSNMEMCTSEYSKTPTYKYKFVYVNKVLSFLDQTKYFFGKHCIFVNDCCHSYCFKFQRFNFLKIFRYNNHGCLCWSQREKKNLDTNQDIFSRDIVLNKWKCLEA